MSYDDLSLLELIDPNNSDYEFSDNSDDEEYIPDIDECEDDYSEDEQRRDQRQQKGKENAGRPHKRNFPGPSWAPSDDEDDDDSLPLAALMRRIDDEDNVPLSRLVSTQGNCPASSTGAGKEGENWRNGTFIPMDVNFKGVLETLPDNFKLKTPYQYFKELVTDAMMESIAEESNRYALMKKGIELKTWLWYRRHCRLLGEKSMKLSDFQAQVATGLIETNQRIGRRSLSENRPNPPKKTQRAPITDVRSDGQHHFPKWNTKRGRCKNTGCDGYTFIVCVKCNVYLCLNKDRNCFMTFHNC